LGRKKFYPNKIGGKRTESEGHEKLMRRAGVPGKQKKGKGGGGKVPGVQGKELRGQGKKGGGVLEEKKKKNRNRKKKGRWR